MSLYLPVNPNIPHRHILGFHELEASLDPTKSFIVPFAGVLYFPRSCRSHHWRGLCHPRAQRSCTSRRWPAPVLGSLWGFRGLGFRASGACALSLSRRTAEAVAGTTEKNPQKNRAYGVGVQSLDVRAQDILRCSVEVTWFRVLWRRLLERSLFPSERLRKGGRDGRTSEHEQNPDPLPFMSSELSQELAMSVSGQKATSSRVSAVSNYGGHDRHRR